MTGVHRCALVVDGYEVAVFTDATVVGAEVGAPERPSAGTVTLRPGHPLPGWPDAGRSCFLILYATTGAPVAKYWLSKARLTGNPVLTCDYIQQMAP
jgi:hypothetical protein